MRRKIDFWAALLLLKNKLVSHVLKRVRVGGLGKYILSGFGAIAHGIKELLKVCLITKWIGLILLLFGMPTSPGEGKLNSDQLYFG